MKTNIEHWRIENPGENIFPAFVDVTPCSPYLYFTKFMEVHLYDCPGIKIA